MTKKLIRDNPNVRAFINYASSHPGTKVIYAGGCARLCVETDGDDVDVATVLYSGDKSIWLDTYILTKKLDKTLYINTVEGILSSILGVTVYVFITKCTTNFCIMDDNKGHVFSDNGTGEYPVFKPSLKDKKKRMCDNCGNTLLCKGVTYEDVKDKIKKRLEPNKPRIRYKHKW